MPQLFTNNATSTLLADIGAGDLSLAVQAGIGALFPSPSGTEFFYCTLDDGTNIEIVKVTARSTDTFTVVRAQDGTTAYAFVAATPTTVELRVTAAAFTPYEGLEIPSGVPGVTDDMLYNDSNTLKWQGEAITTAAMQTIPTLLQSSNSTLGADVTTTTTMTAYTPTITQGRNLITIVLTPLKVGSAIKVSVQVTGSVSTACTQTIGLFKDGASTAVSSSTNTTNGTNFAATTKLDYFMTAPSLSAITFELRGGMDAGGTWTGRKFSSMVVDEFDSAAEYGPGGADPFADLPNASPAAAEGVATDRPGSAANLFFSHYNPAVKLLSARSFL